MSIVKVNTAQLTELPSDLFNQIEITELYANAFRLEHDITFDHEKLVEYGIKNPKIVRLTQLNYDDRSDQKIIKSIVKELRTELRQYFGSRGLINLSTEIKNLSLLEVLDLSANRLDYIPDEIGLLKNLKILNLSCNNLKKIPDSIKNLTNLKCIDLSHNPITEMPPILLEMECLKKEETLKEVKHQLVIDMVKKQDFEAAAAARESIGKSGIYIDRKIGLCFGLFGIQCISATMDL